MKAPAPTQMYDLHKVVWRYSMVSGKMVPFDEATLATNEPYRIIRRKMETYSSKNDNINVKFIPVPNGTSVLEKLRNASTRNQRANARRNGNTLAVK